MWFKRNSTTEYLSDDLRSEAFAVLSKMWSVLRQKAAISFLETGIFFVESYIDIDPDLVY